MSKRLLILGAGQNQIALYEIAKRHGIETVAMDGNPEAPGFSYADASETGDLQDPTVIADAATRHKVDGIYPAAEWGVEAGFTAAHRLGLPGLTPEAALCARHKLAMREALEAAGIPNPAFRGVNSLDEAEQAANENGLPVIVKPVDGNASRGVRRLDYIDDMSLAHAIAEKESSSGMVLIEGFCEGEEFNIDGLMYEGTFIPGGITGKERPASHTRFDLGIFMPPGLGPAKEAELCDLTERACCAIGLRSGTVHLEIITTEDGPRVIEIAARPGGGRIPTDLIPMTYGMDIMADAFRIALGEAPRESRQFEKATSVYWFPARPGIVSEIVGEAEARAMPNVVDLHVFVKPGDEVQHIVDCVTRDRIGYVYTRGKNADEAVATAKKALDVCRVVTRPTV
jgi:biotin carboxylase